MNVTVAGLQEPLAASAAEEFQALWEQGQEAAGAHLQPLERSWELALHRQRKKIVARYRLAAEVLVAAAELPPGSAGNVPSDQIVGTVVGSLSATVETNRERMQQAVLAAFLGDVAAREAVRRATYRELIHQSLSTQILNTEEALRDTVRPVLAQSLAEGWDVNRTAATLNDQLTSFAPWQAMRLARTDLIAIANGTSLAHALDLGDAAPTFKTWLTAGDEKVRPAHVEANRQTVPLDQPFEVDGSAMMFPGDPSAPDALTQNCRCALVYGSGAHPRLAHSDSGPNMDTLALSAAAGSDDVTLALLREAQAAWLRYLGRNLTAAFDPTLHPHLPGGNPAGGEWAPKFSTSVYTYKRSNPDELMMDELNEVKETWPEGANRDMAARAIMDRREGADVVLAKDRDGRIVGAASIFPWSDYDQYPDTATLGYAGAIDNAGLALFEGSVEHVAHIQEGLWWGATVESKPLYDKLGVPLVEKDSEFSYRLTPEQTQLLAEDGFALARKKRHDEKMAITAAFDPSKHPHEPAGSSRGGEWAAKVGVTPFRPEDTVSPETRKAYNAGWNAGQNATQGKVEAADKRRAPAAWYQGFFDADAGNEKYAALSFYESAKYQQFESSLAPTAAKYHVTIDGQERVSGFWQGDHEPSLALDVHDGEDGVRRFAEDLRGTWDQDAVLLFHPDPNGEAFSYRVEGVSGDPSKALTKAGIDGATIHHGAVTVVGSAEDAGKVRKMTEILGVDAKNVTVNVGNLEFVERPS